MPTSDDIKWFKRQFGHKMEIAIVGTPFDLDMLTAIACQETGYIWSRLRRKNLTIERITQLCVGDTIDYKGPKRGRQAFPRNKAELLGKPHGSDMFAIARTALEEMSHHVPGYEKAVSNPDKFCHGYGVFQRDLQFFLNDPQYFLNRDYESFDTSLNHCLLELRRGLKITGLEKRNTISDFEFACVAIAYNTGAFKPGKGLKQGHSDDNKFYGEYIADYLALARNNRNEPTTSPGRYKVIARDGLKLRGGPGTQFEALRTLPFGTELAVVAAGVGDATWAQVDVEGDGALDGFVFAAFLDVAA